MFNTNDIGEAICTTLNAVDLSFCVRQDFASCLLGYGMRELDNSIFLHIRLERDSLHTCHSQKRNVSL